MDFVVNNAHETNIKRKAKSTKDYFLVVLCSS